MQRIIFGASGNEQLTLNSQGNLFGFAGDDTLVASNSVSDFYPAFMVGGSGNDHYVANNLAAVIVDTAGEDKLTLPGTLSQYIGAYVNGQDLTLINTTTGQEVFVVDAKDRGRIETFEFGSGEILSSAAMEQRVYSQGYGDISYAEYNPNFSAQHFQEVKEINKAWADLDWSGVWQTVAQQGEVTNEVVASAVNEALTSMLSPAAQQQWQSQMGPQQLASSQFEGVEQNLPTAPAPASPLIPQESAENIALLYEAALDRVPDIEGLNYWIDEFAGGMSVEGIANSFIQSDEFITNFSVNSDEEFIDQMYLNVLDRPADGEGKAYWLGELDQGLTQAGVLNSFAVSNENVANADWLAGLNESDGNWVF